MSNLADIRAKIAHLMAMGNDERTNQFEAEAALRQAEKLMRKHAIDAAEIQARTGTKPVYNWQRVSVPASVPRPATVCIGWFGSLAVAVAKFTDCAAAWKRHEQYGWCIELRGDAVDVAYGVYLLKHLRDSARRDSANFAGNRREREDFRIAMIGRISQRMETLKREQHAALRQAEHATGSALVVVNTKIALRDAAMGKPSYGTQSRRGSDDFARAAGHAAGDRVGFGRPVEHSTRALAG